jgi:hypothetical protein
MRWDTSGTVIEFPRSSCSRLSYLMPKIGWAGMILLLGACAVDSRPPQSADGLPAAPADSAPAAQLVDSSIPPAVAGAGGWNYQQSAGADLDGDGQAERVVLTAKVELYRGRPAWDDGQPWQVYIEAPDGGRTYLYAQRLQLGTLTLRVGSSEAGQGAVVVLLEQLPDRISLYEVSYGGPGRVTVAVRYQRLLDPTGETASPKLP